MVELTDEHRRDPVERRTPFFLDSGQSVTGVERFSRDHDARPVARAGEVADDHPEAVIERDRNADTIPLRVAKNLAAEEAVVQQVVMRESRSLGSAGRARRVLNVDWVIKGQRRFARGQRLVVDERRVGQQRVPLRVKNEGLFERRALAPDRGEELGVSGLPESERQQQEAGPWTPLRAIKSFVPGITRDNSGIPGMPTRVGATTSGRPLWVAQPEPSSAAVGGCP